MHGSIDLRVGGLLHRVLKLLEERNLRLLINEEVVRFGEQVKLGLHHTY